MQLSNALNLSKGECRNSIFFQNFTKIEDRFIEIFPVTPEDEQDEEKLLHQFP